MGLVRGQRGWCLQGPSGEGQSLRQGFSLFIDLFVQSGSRGVVRGGEGGDVFGVGVEKGSLCGG